MARLWTGVFLTMVAVGVASAQTGDRRSYSTARVTGTPPVIDGRLSDSAWSQVTWSDGFTVQTPNEGAIPTERTGFKILYDDRNLYIAIRMDDREAARIDRRLGRRDEYSGDTVTVWLDSYFDRRTAFAFGVNAGGVKWDAISTGDGGAVDTSWEPVWFVETSVDAEGWSAEFRIPLTQLRFSDRAEQVWGLQLRRQLFRTEETSAWQFIPGRSAGQTSRFGELRGLRDIHPRAQVELMPYAVGQVNRSPAEAGNPFATGSRTLGQAGLDGKIGLTSNVTLDFAVNPDFGQVEADPSVVNLTAFETFYQEKRPFFVEGAGVFDMSISSFGTSAMDRLFYSRRIGRAPQTQPSLTGGEYADVPDRTSILGAAKVTGKTGSGWSLGLLDSVTSREEATIDLAGARRAEAVEPRTNYLVARVQKDYRGGQTTIGGMATAVNRQMNEPQFSFLHDAAYTGGVDVEHFWRDRAYYARGTVVYSYVHGSAQSITRTQRSSPRFFQRPDAGYLHYDPTRTSLTGNGGSVEVGRSGNSKFLVNGSFAWRSPGLDINDLGFQRTADYLVTRVQAQYNQFQPFSIFRTFNSSGAAWVNHLYSGEKAGIGGYVAFGGQLRNYWRVNATVETNTEYLDTTLLRGGPGMMTSARSQAFAAIQTDARKRLNAVVQGQWVWDPNGENDTKFLVLGVTWRPTGALNVLLQPSMTWNAPSMQYVSTASSAAGPRYILAGLDQRTASLTTRVNYSITPRLTIQYYGQPFVSAGRYSDFKQITNPRGASYAERFQLLGGNRITRSAGRVAVDENGDGTQDYAFGDPDYGFRQFRSNLVARWEYSPGSTLYLVWSQGRTGADASGRFSVSDGLHDLFGVQPENVFLIKVSRWLSR